MVSGTAQVAWLNRRHMVSPLSGRLLPPVEVALEWFDRALVQMRANSPLPPCPREVQDIVAHFTFAARRDLLRVNSLNGRPSVVHITRLAREMLEEVA